MLSPHNEYITVCERVLAESLVDVALDLRQLDAADLVAWVHGARFGNVASIVGSAIELHFRPGAMRFALSGDVDLSWHGDLSVRLDMEFHHRGVDCYFRLHLTRALIGIDITYISIDGASCGSAPALKRFETAMIESRRHAAIGS